MTVIDEDNVVHAVKQEPTEFEHGWTACDRLWDYGPCVNFTGEYVPPMFVDEDDVPVTCVVCLGT